MRENLCFAIWVFFLWGSCIGRFVVEKNSPKVTSSDSLKDVYECAIGNFGVPQYGGTMVGIVAYPKANMKACKSFQDFDISYKSKPGGFLPSYLSTEEIGKDSRGDVTILPTLVINNRQYRGKLDKGAVLKAICAGFQETTEPAVCLSDDVETNECLENSGGCRQDKAC